MRVSVRYFAALREALGSGESVEVGPGTTLSALRERLIGSSERHAAVLAHDRAVRCAVDQAMCDEKTLLHEGAEVAFFPPVTGG